MRRGIASRERNSANGFAAAGPWRRHAVRRLDHHLPRGRPCCPAISPRPFSASRPRRRPSRRSSEEIGLDRPPVVRYVDWLGGMVQGDFGISYAGAGSLSGNRRAVAELIAPRLVEHAVPGQLDGADRRAAGAGARHAGRALSQQPVRPHRQCCDADVDLLAGVLPRLHPDAVSCGPSCRIFSLAWRRSMPTTPFFERVYCAAPCRR